jgi:hypothetical protein
MTDDKQAPPPKKILVSPADSFIPIITGLAGLGCEIITLTPQFAESLGGLELEGGVKSIAHFRTAQVTDEAYNYVGKMIADKSALLPSNKNGIVPSVKHFFSADGGVRGYLTAKAPDLALVLIIIDEISPDLVLIHNDVEPLTKLAALWAQANGKPALHVPHSIYQNIENPHDIHAIFTASHVVSSGDYQTKWFIERGFDPARIVETGLPQYDSFANPKIDRMKARGALDLTIQKPVVTYCSSWSQNTNMMGMHDGVETAYMTILEAAKRLPQIQFVIKLHPRAQADQWHVEQAQRVGVDVTIVKEHLPTVLGASDVIIAYGPSNVLLEAANYEFLKLIATSGFEQDSEIMKVSVDPPNIEAMVSGILQALASGPPNYKDFLWRYLGRRDGKAHERITQISAGLLGIPYAE